MSDYENFEVRRYLKTNVLIYLILIKINVSSDNGFLSLDIPFYGKTPADFYKQNSEVGDILS